MKGRLAVTENILYLDNSRRSAFAKCPYRYDLTYNRGVQSINGSTAMRYGTVFHAAMEGYYSHVKEHGWLKDGGALEQSVSYAQKAWDEEAIGKTFYSDYRTFENLIKSLILYLDHFAADEHLIEVVETERAFRIKLSDSVFFTGKLDLEMILSRQRWINEFKTTGQTIQYISNKQSRDSQFVGYTYAMKRMYNDEAPEGILITYHHLSAYKSKKTGEYGQPKVAFDRFPLFFPEQDLIDWKNTFIYTAEQIMDCYSKGVWPKQFDSCHLYGACPYLFLCEQRRPPGEENLADLFVTREPWNVLETVSDDRIITIE